MTKKQKKELKRIIIAIVIYAVLMLVDRLDLYPIHPNQWVTFLLFLVPYLIVGLEVLAGAVHGIRNKQMLDETFLMTLATFGAFAAGEYSEGVAVMLFYQVGEFFQDYAVNRSRNSIKELMDISPEIANVEREDGTIETIDPDEVEIGDTLVVKPGEKIPVDGIVLEGSSRLNTSALTGESVPRSVHPGEEVISGCINGEQLLKIRAEKRFEDSTVARILEMVENASEKKSKTENFITRFARYYTPLVVGAAVFLALVPPMFDGEWMKWIMRACIFLVISCPCALVISVPLAFFGGIGAASKQGMLVKGSNYLELLAKIDTLVTDKTGTLTQGNFRVVNVLLPQAEAANDGEQASLGTVPTRLSSGQLELLKLAASAEHSSTHPIAISISGAYNEQSEDAGISEALYKTLSAENLAGQGIIVTLENAPYEKLMVGNASLLSAQGITAPENPDPAATAVYIAGDGNYLGTLLIRDELKVDSGEALAQLRSLGVRRIVMTTGDSKEVGEAVGNELGIDTVYAQLMPQDKVAKVEELMDHLPKNHCLAVIGDGINDAPVLSRADVGIAMGSLGSDAAIEAADIVIMDDKLSRLGGVIDIAKKTISVSKQNIIFALGIKLLILTLGAVGLANMWAAVFADVGVAVICILNSMRLLSVRKTV